MDNSIDEALAGFGEEIKVILNKDGSVTVEDNGRGVPVGMHISGKSTPEVIFTVLHAGGKFSDAAYKTSGGLHGVGSSVTNALSEWMDVTIYRDKKEHNIRFENGGNVAKKLMVVGPSNRRGTSVTFKPDANVFSTTEFNYTTIATRLKEKAYLMKNLKMTLVDKNLNKEETFQFKD